MKSKTFGVLAAAAVAGMMAGTPAFGAKIVDGHYCHNNTCKGKSACGGMGNKNGCAGSNECKGQGWLDQSTKADCEANGGKWAKAPAEGKKKKKHDKKAKKDS